MNEFLFYIHPNVLYSCEPWTESTQLIYKNSCFLLWRTLKVFSRVLGKLSCQKENSSWLSIHEISPNDQIYVQCQELRYWKNVSGSCSSVFIVDFEQILLHWAIFLLKLLTKNLWKICRFFVVRINNPQVTWKLLTCSVCKSPLLKRIPSSVLWI